MTKEEGTEAMNDVQVRAITRILEVAGPGAYVLPAAEEPGWGWLWELTMAAASLQPTLCDRDSAGCEYQYGPGYNPCACYAPGHQMNPFLPEVQEAWAVYERLEESVKACREDPYGPQSRFWASVHH